ncbi:protein C19orf12 homolog [Drosophila rhopaloa]|uniref:Protein C19orf12 homolog n=1 Tax=Drosophila rhopaloa TaxID=1041015 RepID=A0A6P4FD35_DRORH|nr:protein C19orf12 homolog [Drosophila rhopaloa]
MKDDMVLGLLCTLADNDGMRVTFKKTFIRALGSVFVSGAALVIGGKLMGPFGLVVGGAVGGLAVYVLSKGQGRFKLASEVIRSDLSNKQLRALKNHVMKDLPSEKDQEVVAIILMNDHAQFLALEALKKYFTNSLGSIILNNNCVMPKMYIKIAGEEIF